MNYSGFAIIAAEHSHSCTQSLAPISLGRYSHILRTLREHAISVCARTLPSPYREYRVQVYKYLPASIAYAARGLLLLSRDEHIITHSLHCVTYTAATEPGMSPSPLLLRLHRRLHRAPHRRCSRRMMLRHHHRQWHSPRSQRPRGPSWPQSAPDAASLVVAHSP